jgi:lipid-binding SYLF domain-containing protein
MTLATVFAAIAILSFGVSTAVADNERLEARQSVEKAKVTIDEFKADPSMTWFRDNLPKAKAVLVVPVLIKGGLILGGSGGHGALLWHDEETDTWSYPAFYFMGAVTFGLQIGGEAAQVVLMVMTEKGRRALLSSEFKLGADVSVAAGPVGAGAQAATTDVLAFSRNKGLFGGLTAEGSIVSPRQEWNDAYYGEPAATTDILIRQSVANSHADPLRQSVALARAAAAPAPVAAEPEEPAPTATPAQTYDLATIQAALNAEGYDAGPADGLMGANTRAAIRSYQAAAGFEVTGNPSLALQRSLAGGN